MCRSPVLPATRLSYPVVLFRMVLPKVLSEIKAPSAFRVIASTTVLATHCFVFLIFADSLLDHR